MASDVEARGGEHGRGGAEADKTRWLIVRFVFELSERGEWLLFLDGCPAPPPFLIPVGSGKCCGSGWLWVGVAAHRKSCNLQHDRWSTTWRQSTISICHLSPITSVPVDGSSLFRARKTRKKARHPSTHLQPRKKSICCFQRSSLEGPDSRYTACLLCSPQPHADSDSAELGLASAAFLQPPHHTSTQDAIRATPVVTRIGSFCSTSSLSLLLHVEGHSHFQPKNSTSFFFKEQNWAPGLMEKGTTRRGGDGAVIDNAGKAGPKRSPSALLCSSLFSLYPTSLHVYHPSIATSLRLFIFPKKSVRFPHSLLRLMAPFSKAS
jgi:hypothetical protein